MVKQCEAVAITLIYSGVMSFILLKIVDLLVGLRVTRDQETEGLDIVLHGETIGLTVRPRRIGNAEGRSGMAPPFFRYGGGGSRV